MSVTDRGCTNGGEAVGLTRRTLSTPGIFLVLISVNLRAVVQLKQLKSNERRWEWNPRPSGV
jgi:hypothetical protein